EQREELALLDLEIGGAQRDVLSKSLGHSVERQEPGRLPCRCLSSDIAHGNGGHHPPLLKRSEPNSNSLINRRHNTSYVCRIQKLARPWARRSYVIITQCHRTRQSRGTKGR